MEILLWETKKSRKGGTDGKVTLRATLYPTYRTRRVPEPETNTERRRKMETEKYKWTQTNAGDCKSLMLVYMLELCKVIQYTYIVIISYSL